MKNFQNNYIFSTLKKNPEVRINTLHLIEESFGYSGGYQFKIDFHPLVSINNAENNHILIDKLSGEVIGHIGVLPKFLKNEKILTPTTLFGGMCIRKNHRGKGIFRYFFGEIIKKYEQSSALMLLWSNLTDLYNKFGFYEAGTIYQTGSDSFNDILLAKIYEKTKFKKLNKFQFESIKKLYEGMSTQGNTIFHRSNQDWEDIKGITSTDLYLNTDDGIINGYFCINKGYDLNDIIHEVAFDKKSKSNMIETLKEFKLWATPGLLSNTKNLTPLYAGFFRPGNIDLFKDFIEAWSYGEIEIININGSLVSYKHLDDPFMDNTAEFFKRIFGPDKHFDGFNYGPPLYISGLDSI